AANLGKLVLDTMGLDADTYSVVINGDISDPGVGIGQFCGAGNVEIYVKNNTTGEETDHETINTSSRKLNHVVYDGTICLYTCPEDSEVWKPAEEILGAMRCSDASHEDPIIHALFPDEASFTEENFVAAIAAAIEDVEGAEIQITKFDPARLNTDSTCRVYVYAWNDNVLEATDEISFICSTAAVDAPVLSAEHPVAEDPMIAAFEDFLDEYLCVTHNALTTAHNGGSNFNANNIAALVLSTMGLDAGTYSVVLNGSISDPGVGIGQFCGASNVEIYVVNNTTGEETEHETINLSSRKLNHVSGIGTVCLYTCPEDSMLWKPIEETLDAMICHHTDGDGDPYDIIHAVFPDAESFTQENFVTAIRAAIGTNDGEIVITKFDPARLNTDSSCRFYVYEWVDGVLEATGEYSCLCSVDSSVTTPALIGTHVEP
ncbi:MAG: hypothetical protein II736_02000, partial [Clostridia bacterium]|nr:hypothetical protein [Clostridia bacterium]